MGYDTDLDCSTGIWWSLGVCASTTSVSSWITVVDASSFLGWLLVNSVMLNRNCMQPTLMQLLWWSNAVPSQPAPLPPIRLELLALQLQGDLGPPWAWLLIIAPTGISTASAHTSPRFFLDLLPPADLPWDTTHYDNHIMHYKNKMRAVLTDAVLYFGREPTGWSDVRLVREVTWVKHIVYSCPMLTVVQKLIMLRVLWEIK